MRKIGLVVLLCLCCTISVVSQDVVVMFDESGYADNSKMDTIVSDTLAALFPSADYVLDTLSHSDEVSSAPVITAHTFYYRSDVRHIRDSLKQAMRMARGTMHKNIRDMRDSVRCDARES